jgi:uncharacterized protein YecE (DUF72 family)
MSRRGSRGDIRIGVSGWRYGGWRGIFYPPHLAQHRELEFAARAFDTVEINGSFYSLQSPASYAAWYAATPPGFVFAVKGARYITHFRRLDGDVRPLANFLASGLFNLRDKLGPILWQFPPFFAFDPPRFERFFTMLPRDTAEALAVARQRDPRMYGRSRLAIDLPRPMRHAVEVRHPSFFCREFVELLRRHGVALVFADTARKWPYAEDVTADFVYLRLHGATQLYASGYGDASLSRWADRIDAWSRGGEPSDARRITHKPPAERARRDVYCYFDNDVKVRAPFDARRLAERLGVVPAGGEIVFPPRSALRRVAVRSLPRATSGPWRLTPRPRARSA